MKKKLIIIVTGIILIGVVVFGSFNLYAQYSNNGYRSVMYYGDWSVWGGQSNYYPKDIPADKITHLNYAFLDFDQNGNLVWTDQQAAVGAPVGQDGVGWDQINSGLIPAIKELKSENPNLKVGISLGGWSKSGDFSTVAADPIKRANLIDQTIQFIDYVGFDFVDIDWEYPNSVRQPDLIDNKRDEGTPAANPSDIENFTILLEEFRVALDELGETNDKYYELSVAVPASVTALENNYQIEQVFEICDFVNLMTYDLNGAWSPTTGHQTNLYSSSQDPMGDEGYSIDKVVQYLINDKGVDSSKIVIGSAFYTRGWQGVESENNGLYSNVIKTGEDADGTPSAGAVNEAPLVSGDGGRLGGVWSYRNLDQLKAKYPDLEEYWDDEAKAPYLYSEEDGLFFTYDNPRSVTEKSNYVKENNLGGIISWQSSNDSPTDSSKRDELTNVIYDNLIVGQNYENKTIYPENNIDVEIKPIDNDYQFGYEITVDNLDQLTESNQVLKDVELKSKSLSLPKYYIKTSDTVIGTDYRGGIFKDEGSGLYSFDLAGVYDARFLKPQESYTFNVYTKDQVNVSNIESISVSTRSSSTGPEITNQEIYSSNLDNSPTINGINNLTISQFSEFDSMDGVSALDIEDGDLTNQITINGEVNTEVIGQYNLNYSVVDQSGNQTEESRTVDVIENGIPNFIGLDAQSIVEGTEFDPMKGVTAVDIEDGDITNNIEVIGQVDSDKSGQYILTYQVEDSDQNVITQDRVISVEENQPPVIVGAENISIKKDSNFDPMKGVTADDDFDGDITDQIQVIGEVNTGVEATYELYYKITDSNQVETLIMRKVIVVSDQNSDVTEMVNPEDKVLIGYWHNWVGGDGYKGGTAQEMKLTDVNDYYNVIAVSFMKVYDNQESRIPTFIPDPTIYPDEQDFIDDIAELNSQGTSVILSLGGADAHIELQEGDYIALADEIIRLTDKYGFDGIDIDLEQSAITAGDNQTEIVKALKLVKEHYLAQGENFLIGMAPEFPYLTKQNNKYQSYIEGLDGYYDWIAPQYYNQAGDGVSVGSEWIAQNNDQRKEDFLYYLTKSILEGTNGYLDLNIPSDKFVIGLPSNIDAAANGYVQDPEDVKNAYKRLKDDGYDIKGLMTWSVNWDQGTNSSDQNYNDQFANTYGPWIESIENDQSNNQAPKLIGLKDQTIEVGDTFDPLEGIYAQDDYDGDITDEIEITGSVDINKAGVYELIYQVADKEGMKTEKIIKITVKETVNNNDPYFIGVDDKSINQGDDFDLSAGVKAFDQEDGEISNKIIIKGTIDSNVAGKYNIEYSVTDNNMSTIKVNRQITVKSDSSEIDPDAIPDYNPQYHTQTGYTNGSIVKYKGKIWKQTSGQISWWGEPGKHDAWTQIAVYDYDQPIDEWDANYQTNNGYYPQEKVIHNGKTWIQNTESILWWGEPGEHNAWVEVK